MRRTSPGTTTSATVIPAYYAHVVIPRVEICTREGLRLVFSVASSRLWLVFLGRVETEATEETKGAPVLEERCL